MLELILLSIGFLLVFEGLIYYFFAGNMKNFLDQISKEKAQEIIRFAIACGAHVCKGLGAIDAQPYKEDIDQLLST